MCELHVTSWGYINVPGTYFIPQLDERVGSITGSAIAIKKALNFFFYLLLSTIDLPQLINIIIYWSHLKLHSFKLLTVKMEDSARDIILSKSYYPPNNISSEAKYVY